MKKMLAVLLLIFPFVLFSQEAGYQALMKQEFIKLKQMEKPDPRSIGRLGAFYYHGTGTKPDKVLGLKLMLQAFALGDAHSAYNLALIQLAGLPSDTPVPPGSLNLIVFAAERGDEVAQHHLGNLFRDGNGVERSEEQSRSWYEKAKANGYRFPQDSTAPNEAH